MGEGVERQLQFAQWRANMAAMKERVRERFRVTSVSQRFLRQSQRLQPGGGVGWRGATATFAVARVFQGNIVLARMARSITRNEWQKRMGKFGEFLPKFRTLAASVTVGSAAVFSEPAQAEALASPSTSYRLGAADYDDHEVTITLKRQSSGQHQAMILAVDPTITEKQEIGLFRDDSAFLRTMQAVAIPLIGNACHIFMHGLNSTEVYGAEKMQQAVCNRPVGQPLITVSNHRAAVDDPFVISSLLPPHKLLNASTLRWTLCASEKCFSSPATAAFFRSVKVLPLTKGLGVFQEGMEVALTKLNRGEWVHIFPEGSRSRDGDVQLFKRGVGRLVLDADNLPLVVPFIHTGMHEIMPIGQKLFSTGKKVTILVGDPIHVEDLVKKHIEEGLSKAVLYDAIALRIETTMLKMKKELDELVVQSNKVASEKAHTRVQMIEKVQGIWQYGDWEAQGMLLDGIGSGPKPGIIPNDRNGDDTVNSPSQSSAGVADVGGGGLDGELYPGDAGELRVIDVYSGALNRIQARMDPSMLMGFAARGLVASRSKLDNGLESLSRRYWRQMAALERNSWHTC